MESDFDKEIQQILIEVFVSDLSPRKCLGCGCGKVVHRLESSRKPGSRNTSKAENEGENEGTTASV